MRPDERVSISECGMLSIERIQLEMRLVVFIEAKPGLWQAVELPLKKGEV